VQTIIIIAGGVIFIALLSYHNKKQKALETRQQYSEQNIDLT
jgi:hypothetical protein